MGFTEQLWCQGPNCSGVELHDPGVDLHDPGVDLHAPGVDLHAPGVDLHVLMVPDAQQGIIRFKNNKTGNQNAHVELGSHCLHVLANNGPLLATPVLDQPHWEPPSLSDEQMTLGCCVCWGPLALSLLLFPCRCFSATCSHSQPVQR